MRLAWLCSIESRALGSIIPRPCRWNFDGLERQTSIALPRRDCGAIPMRAASWIDTTITFAMTRRPSQATFCWPNAMVKALERQPAFR